MSERLVENVKAFDGSSMDVANWLKKLKLVVKLKKIGDLASVIPLFLEGPAFEVYDQMAEGDKEDASRIENVLLAAFAQSGFDAFDNFRQRSWITGEPVDVYLADLRRLARLAKVEDDMLLRRAFVVGLPFDVSSQLRVSSDIESMSLDKVLDKARVLVANRTKEFGLLAVKNGKQFKPRSVTCFNCSEEGHIARFCPTSNYHGNKVSSINGSQFKPRSVTCFNCSEEGHLARFCQKRNCVSSLVKDSGKQHAPAASRAM